MFSFTLEMEKETDKEMFTGRARALMEAQRMIPRSLSLIAALSPFPEPGPELLFLPSPQAKLLARVSLAVRLDL